VLDAQYKDDSSDTFDFVVVSVNHGFTGVFALELAINLFANWFRLFAKRSPAPNPAAAAHAPAV
jgi:hypothetical protein